MMKKIINEKLHELIGLEWVKTTRASNMECLKFGTLYSFDNKGIRRQFGQFGLHLQCPWRITKKDLILVGSDDLYEQPNEIDEYDENFNWDVQGGNLRDVKLESLLKCGKYIVSSVKADIFGGFELVFNDNLKLTVFPILSSKSRYSEYWRILDNRNEKREHFVVGALGIEK